ncbi:hypothetical protein KP509_04G056600 [Ceratopteris richardii]|uniref:Uncharacterized protein n=1 Tax=Ceratopteris richardii TaxID=49495 RepID=A0A8T2UVN2_CERRI|nr:hypothetical protein KP509_04G056600 [Ceratopteris richardii]
MRSILHRFRSPSVSFCQPYTAPCSIPSRHFISTWKSVLQRFEDMSRVLDDENPKRNSNVLSSSIHPTAIVHQEAVIHEGVVIGPYCTVGPEVKLGKGCLMHPNSHVLGKSELGEGCILHIGAVVGADGPGHTILGRQNVIGHHAVVGVKCQDLKYKVLGFFSICFFLLYVWT